MEGVYFDNLKGMSIAAVGTGKKPHGYLAVCRLLFGEHLVWRNPRCVNAKGRETFGNNHALSN